MDKRTQIRVMIETTLFSNGRIDTNVVQVRKTVWDCFRCD